MRTRLHSLSTTTTTSRNLSAFSSLRRPFLAILVGVLTAGWLITASAVRGDQILETDSSCLTSYLHSSATNIHGVRPLVEQRGVNLDGSLKNGGAFAMRIGGSPFGDGVGWSGNARSNGMWLDTGTFAVSDVDLSLPAPGFRWNVSRSYNAHQEDSGSSHLDSNGYQGRNWFQNTQPEILLYEGTTDDEDIVYLVYGADRFLEFRRTASTSDVFKGKNGAAGVFEFAAGATNEPDTYALTDQHGNEIVFFGFDADASPCDGQFWKMSDPDGNTAYVGDSSTGSTAISNGYDSSGYITEAYDTAGRKYTYAYSTIDSVDRLTQVKAEVNDSGWVEVGKVDYAYYQTGDNTYGDNGTLKQVKITTPLSDSGVSLERKKYYRYWKGTFNASTNPGHPYGLKYVVDFEGVRNYDWTQDSSLDDDHHSASNDNLKPYASAYFEYDSSHRIDEAWFNGACGCSGGANGTYSFEYETNGSYTDNSGYDQTWARRTIVLRPDNAYITQYFDEVGQPLSRVLTDADPDNTSPTPDTWVHEITRNTDGQIDEKRTPAANDTYTHSTGAIAAETGTGLILEYTRVSSGDMKGLLASVKHKIGTSGTAYFDRDLDYDSTPPSKTIGTGDTADVVRPVVDQTQTYATETTLESGGAATAVTTTAYAGADALALKQADATNPTVGTAENGSNSATTNKSYRDESGAVTFTKNEDAMISYREYTGGQLTKSIQDADTTKTGSGEDFENVTVPGDFASSGSSPFHRVTTYVYDDQGRLDTVTSPSGRVSKTYYSKLADGRTVTLRYPKYETSPSTKFYGPVSYAVMNHAGQAEVTATVSLSGNTSTSAITAHIDETDSDPILAMDLGTVARLSVSVMDEPGSTVEESRAFFNIPASGDGTEGTNFDSTYFGYDDMGRRWRTKSPTGTIQRSAYDAIGRTQYSYVGTNDSSFTGGEASGTDDMVKISEVVYDSGNDGENGLVTKTTAFVEDSATDRRDTTYEYDSRGRRIVTNNPVAPHSVVEYDNIGRVVAAATYSGTSNISASTDPDASGTQTDRIGLSTSDYDPLGRAWETKRYKIDQSDGSDDDSLQTLTWYDDAGRVIKVDGGQLTKTFYDRIGRQTHSFVLAVAENSGGSVESTYADADDLEHDIVLIESQTTYGSGTDDNVLMQATIERLHDDNGTSGNENTGALDTNVDADDLLYTAANLDGRIQITAMWYDDVDRLEDTVQYGTYGGSNFDRDGLSVPTRSDTALRTTTTYNDDGSVKEITDPKALVTRYEYDDAGRQTAVIANYVNGVPSGSTGDDDVFTRYVYTDGLQTKIWVDVDGDDTEDADDQVTTYGYGTTKGASAGDSNIGTGHLPQKVTYPDSASGTDVVTYAYNAQSQQIWMKDQAGNIIETDFDDGGRETHRRATTTAGGFDTSVLRVTSAYTSRGGVETVTQYDNATVGSGSVVDQVKYTRDDWGNVTKFEQDRNSAVTGGEDDGSYGYYDVDYTYAKATAGRNTLQRSTMVLPKSTGGDTTLTYEYLSTSNLHDSDASRVTRVKVGATAVATYAYNGVGSVVGEDYPEPDVMWNRYGTTSGSYPDLDRFNRVTDSRWTTDLGTDVDFYDIDITYDRNSNITLIEDNVHVGFDVDYTNDSLNRLTKAEEGTWGGSSISSRTRNQEWTLDQVGNWDVGKLDLDGDDNFNETNEYNDDRTHNVVNELTGRDTDDNGTDNFTLTYDAVGNLTDDGENYEYEYDVFGRLRKINDTSDQSLVAEYKYNGLNFKISVHEDTDTDGDVDASDKWFHGVYDTNWRLVSLFRDDDTDPKEQLVRHNAGADGFGGSSYIDRIILRDRDNTNGIIGAPDGTLEERRYYCQNWRHDVSAVVTSGGVLVEWGKYSSYGVPFGLPGADTDSDGDCDATDITQIQTWIDAPTYDVRADLDLDGDVDSTDKTTAQSNYQGTTLGWNVLSGVRRQHGYAGYEWDAAVSKHHVRNRVLDPHLGRWTRRDPLGFIDGQNLSEYAASNPARSIDPTGLGSCGPTPQNPGECCACNLWAIFDGRFAGENQQGDLVDIYDYEPDAEYPHYNVDAPHSLGEFHYAQNDVFVFSGYTYQLLGTIDPHGNNQASADACGLSVLHQLRNERDGTWGVVRHWAEDTNEQLKTFDDYRLYLTPQIFQYTWPSWADVPGLEFPDREFHKNRVTTVEWEWLAILRSTPGASCNFRQCWVRYKLTLDLTPLRRRRTPNWRYDYVAWSCTDPPPPVSGVPAQ